jgi:hypothetical protein
MLKAKKFSKKSEEIIKKAVPFSKPVVKEKPVAKVKLSEADQFIADMDNWRQAKDMKKEHTFHGVVDDKAVFMRSRGTEVIELIVDGNISSLGKGATPEQFKECLKIALS